MCGNIHTRSTKSTCFDCAICLTSYMTLHFRHLPCAYARTHAYTCVHAHAHTHTPMHTHTRAYTRVHAPMCAHVRRACACADAHTPANAPVSLSEPLHAVFHPSPVCLPSPPVKRLTEPYRRLYSRFPSYACTCVCCHSCSSLHNCSPFHLCKTLNCKKNAKKYLHFPL